MRSLAAVVVTAAVPLIFNFIQISQRKDPLIDQPLPPSYFARLNLR